MNQMNDAQQEALKLAEAYGFGFIPLDGKRPVEQDWPNKVRRTAEEIAALPEGNLGITCEGITVIDFDPRNMDVSDPDDENVVDMAIDLIRRQYGLVDTLEIVTGRAGLHLFYKGETRLKIKDRGVDVKSGRAHQVVAPGSVHPDTGKSYRVWKRGVMAGLPSSLSSSSPTDSGVEWDGESHEMSPEGIEEGNRNDGLYRHLCLMRRRGLNDIEIETYAVVANKLHVSPPLEPNELRQIVRQVQTFEPGQHDIEVLAGLHDRLPAKADDDSEEWSTLGEIEELPEPKYLIERVIPATGVGHLVGASYAGKTFAALDMVMSLADKNTKTWFGHKLCRPEVKTAYVAMEGGFDLGQRLRAWQGYKGKVGNENLRFLVEKTFDLQTDMTALARLYDSGWHWDVLVIDTQSLAAPRLDENDNSHMTALMATAKKISVIYDCFVLLVHHAGYSGERARGASSQFANMDVSLFVGGPTTQRKNRILRMDKLKSGPLANTMQWDLVEVGESAVAEYLTTEVDLEKVGQKLDEEELTEYEAWKQRIRSGGSTARNTLFNAVLHAASSGHVSTVETLGSLGWPDDVENKVFGKSRAIELLDQLVDRGGVVEIRPGEFVPAWGLTGDEEE